MKRALVHNAPAVTQIARAAACVLVDGDDGNDVEVYQVLRRGDGRAHRIAQDCTRGWNHIMAA